jgi:glutathione synthase/RimK-type ligase-like ATP-grasp enzyme
MKIAIHKTEDGFHHRWRLYCTSKKIPFKNVDCYADDIIEQLKDCDALMWHFWQTSSKDFIKAKRLLFALEHSGFTVFPDFKTSWHFDDKVAQKYLLESIGLPLVKSYHFINKKQALHWANHTSYPKVFKLKGGAGSANVKLAQNKSDTIKLINKAFGDGFKQYDKISALKERYRNYKQGKDNFLGVLKSVYRVFNEPVYSKVLGIIKNEVYFQDFIPDNDSDLRVIIIDNKAFAIKRLVRENDFRASGSGYILYNKKYFNESLIEKSFDYARKLNMQSCAFDFVILNGEPLIVEISYGYAIEVYNDCVGYWNSDLKFFEGTFDSTNWMIDSVVNKIKSTKSYILK